MLNKDKLNNLLYLLKDTLSDVPTSIEDYICSVEKTEFGEIAVVLAIEKLIEQLELIKCKPVEVLSLTKEDAVDLNSLFKCILIHFDSISDYFKFLSNDKAEYTSLKEKATTSLIKRAFAEEAVRLAQDTIDKNKTTNKLEEFASD